MNQKLPTPDEQRRLLLAVFLSMLIMIGYFGYLKPRADEHQRAVVAAEETARAEQVKEVMSEIPVKQNSYPKGMKFLTEADMKKEKSDKAIYKNSSYAVVNDKISAVVTGDGSSVIAAKLKKYKKEIGKDEPVLLLEPLEENNGYTIETGWLPSYAGMDMPGTDSYWNVQLHNSKKEIVPGKKATFRWANKQGLNFARSVEIDNDYMVKIESSIANTSEEEVVVYPYARITRKNHPLEGRKVVHEGPVGYVGEELHEYSYEKIIEEGKIKTEGTTGWIGITDKYWLTAIIPEQTGNKTFRFNAVKTDDKNTLYQADVRGSAVVIKPNEVKTVTDRFFIGAKELSVLNRYEEELKVQHFDLAIDFGWYYFLTKPLSMFLHNVGGWLHSHGIDVAFGITLLLITVFVRLLTYPLADKSFRSMNAMKKLQPQMAEIKEKYKGNPQEMQKKFLELYQTENVTPFSGCWPMFVQIPIFFALYKTLYISLDMRQAPFWGWIHDLSVPDPSSVLNLFGLIPVELPSALVIGVWPILYGVTMMLQQRLSPTPPDKIQESMLFWMPWIFCYMFSQLPAGMVIYFVWSNILGIAQQYYLQHKMGLEPSLFRRTSTDEFNNKVMASDKILHSERKKKKNAVDAVEVKDKK